jgi:hypothetical protein
MPISRKKTFGQVREIPAETVESRIVPFVLSTSQRDRYNTVLNQDNWNLAGFRANPIVGYMHNVYGNGCSDPDPSDVIGKGLNARTDIVNGSRCLVDEGFFEPRDLNLKADSIYRKLMLGTLRACSVGFSDFGKGRFGTGEEAEGKSNETYYFEGQELYEWSVVSVPGNPGAGKRDMQLMRDNTYSALMYVSRELGKKFSLSQISQLRVCDVLDLLAGKDLEIRETDPDKVRKMIMEEMALNDRNAIIEKQQSDLMKRMIAVKA